MNNSISLASRRKHKTPWNVLVEDCTDKIVAKDFNSEGCSQFIYKTMIHLIGQILWDFHNMGTWYSNEMQNLLSFESKTSNQWEKKTPLMLSQVKERLINIWDATCVCWLMKLWLLILCIYLPSLLNLCCFYISITVHPSTQRSITMAEYRPLWTVSSDLLRLVKCVYDDHLLDICQIKSLLCDCVTHIKTFIQCNTKDDFLKNKNSMWVFNKCEI